MNHTDLLEKIFTGIGVLCFAAVSVLSQYSPLWLLLAVVELVFLVVAFVLHSQTFEDSNWFNVVSSTGVAVALTGLSLMQSKSMQWVQVLGAIMLIVGALVGVGVELVERKRKNPASIDREDAHDRA